MSVKKNNVDDIMHKVKQLIEKNMCDYVPELELDKFIKLNEVDLDMHMLCLNEYKKPKEVYICCNKPFNMMIGGIVYTFYNNKYYFPHTLIYHEMRLYITDNDNEPDVYVREIDIDKEINKQLNIQEAVYTNVKEYASKDTDTHYLYTDGYMACLLHK